MNDNSFDQEHVTAHIDAWLDGELSASDLADFDDHLGRCESCRAEVEAAEQVAGLARSLRDAHREQQPARDLWPGIEAAIKAGDGGKPARISESNWFRGLAAAAVLGMVYMGGMMTVMRQPAMPTGDIASAAPVQYEVSDIKDSLPAPHFQLVSDDRLSDQTRETLLHNLMIVNLAIREVQQALDDEPDNVQLRKLLRSLYEQENDILNRAERIASTRESNQVRSGI
ncbi:MAG: zf-HC2 domain-containing protein [Gammaproteobacteria bacterium]|nr:zf-HC2 domain-containing protein [Gammaproteobacteria bacterium]